MKLVAVPNRFDERVLTGTTASGLTLLVHPRPDYARTFAALGVNFGSVDRSEGPGRPPVPAGLAHFLEHKLFEDADGDVSDRFACLGASTNAMTGFCRTSYIFSTVSDPAPCLDLLLDFVQQPYFTDALVEKEQGIIAQEIRMHDDDPDWRIFFGLLGCLYHRHPVKDNIAGTLDSIRQIDADTLSRCFRWFYHPANLCLAVSGAMDPDEVAASVEADQQRRPGAPRPRHARGPAVEPEGCASGRFEQDMPVARPRLLLGFKDTAVGTTGQDLARRELATRILLDLLLGRSSKVFEALYADGLVDETFGATYTSEASFGFSTLGGDTDDPARLEERLRVILEDARRNGLDRLAFGRVRDRLYGALLRSLDSPEHMAYSMVSGSFRDLDPLGLLDLLESLRLEDLERRLREHLRESALAVAVVRPARTP